jgi:hypothetical protein
VLLVVAAVLACTDPSPVSPPPAKHKLLVLDVKAPDASIISKTEADTLTNVITTRASRFSSLQVLSSSDLRDLANVAADKASCDAESASCLAELAGALGAELVLSTRAGKLDAEYVVSLNLFDTRNTTAEGRASVQSWNLSELADKIGPELDQLLEKATGEKPAAIATTSTTTAKSPLTPELRVDLEVVGAITAGVGVVAVVLGAIPALQYNAAKDDLRNKTASFDGSAAALDAAVKVRADAESDKDLYNNVGHWAVDAGLLFVVLGGAAVGVGFLAPGAE